MSQIAHIDRRDMAGSPGRGAGPNIPAVGDVVRQLLNKIATLRLAAEARGDIDALFAADAIEPMIAGLKGR